MGTHSLSFDYLFFLHGLVWSALGVGVWGALRLISVLRRKNLTNAKTTPEPSPRAIEAELLAAKNAAETATRAKSEFLAVMSHEIRTPLGGVMGMLELLRKLPQGPQERHYTQLAHESAEALVSILDDILDASKIEAGRLSLESIPFDIRHELSRAVECMRVRAMSRNLALSYTLSPELPKCIKGDPTRLRQVVLNLLSNAIKFTEHGEVRLDATCERKDERRVRLCISVTDTGIGMTPETQARLFSKFVQGDASTTRRYGGTGLGLSIAKHIVDLMNGSIDVESQVGVGSMFTFQVEVPIASANEMPAELTSHPAYLAPHPVRLRVLCAEDEMINRVVTEGLVASMGHTIEFACDGFDVLSKLATTDYDVVLMDNRMPRKDGLQTTREIRHSAGAVRDPEIYIVAATANASAEHRAASLAAGMDGFITKPYREADLHAALSDAIAFQRQRGKFASNVWTTSAIPFWDDFPQAPALSETELLAMVDTATAADRTPSLETPAPAIVRQYLVDAPLRLDQLRSALKTSDAATLGLAAHSLKNISHYVSASRLSALAAKIEAAADTGRFDDAVELFPFAEEEFEIVRERLRNNLPCRRETADCR